jgi:inosine-uridine nucleoside N-ribohydrolase
MLDVDTASGSVGGESDDALAILLALKSPELKLEGITTGPGNVDTRSATLNTLRVLEIAGRSDIPVAEGRADTFLVDRHIREHYDLRHTKPPASAYWTDWKVPPAPKLKPGVYWVIDQPSPSDSCRTGNCPNDKAACSYGRFL